MHGKSNSFRKETHPLGEAPTYAADQERTQRRTKLAILISFVFKPSTRLLRLHHDKRGVASSIDQ